ncbi:hypothetical protein MUA90_03300 [Staphylococcus sp. IVB6181]|uniref:hypothetical protein n=1 Tax=Staphylococcus sp. IVB6181 TaxID=2929481 RepID=UPI0021D1B502|nr:hypothetical protein [Staphylococcus sp. IVB6181]UXV35561.1 hypothetical protein MUA90_03300 [Staphylococcus sp. IVB6181]
MGPSYSQLKETVSAKPLSKEEAPFLHYYDFNVSDPRRGICAEKLLNNWNTAVGVNINTNIITAEQYFSLDKLEDNVKYHLVVITPKTNTAMIIDLNKEIRFELANAGEKYIYDVSDYLKCGENHIYAAFLSRQLTDIKIRDKEITNIDCYILKEYLGRYEEAHPC